MELNKKIVWIYLSLFLLLGIYLRIQHVDFPSIGYHNMKENEYYAETLFMNQNHDYFNRYTWTFYGLTDNAHFDEYMEAPILSWLTIPFWKVGIGSEQLWPMRMIIILFALGAIIFTYLVVKKLSDNEYLSLLSAFLITIMPLGVYFGQNVQPDMPAMFCTLVATFFFLKWRENLKEKYLLYSMLAVSMAGIFKMTFMIILVPLFFMLPFKRLLEKNTLKQIIISILGLVPFILTTWLFTNLIVDKSRIQVEAFSIGFARIFDISYWQQTMPALMSYFNDNYTWWFFWFAIFGIIFALMNYKYNPNSLLSKFVSGNLIAIFLYVGICSGKIGGHSFYQMPFLPLVCITSAYCIFTIGMFTKMILSKVKYVEYTPILIILLILPTTFAADNRVWGTIFPGQDVEGEWLRYHMNENERFFALATSQEYAICTYARRFCGEWDRSQNITYLEQKYGIKYLYISAYRMGDLQTNSEAEYIKNNYHIALVGLMPNGDKLGVYNLILEKGGTLNFDDINKGHATIATAYWTPQGQVDFYIMDLT